jgi:hypothetical protein
MVGIVEARKPSRLFTSNGLAGRVGRKRKLRADARRKGRVFQVGGVCEAEREAAKVLRWLLRGLQARPWYGVSLVEWREKMKRAARAYRLAQARSAKRNLVAVLRAAREAIRANGGSATVRQVYDLYRSRADARLLSDRRVYSLLLSGADRGVLVARRGRPTVFHLPARAAKRASMPLRRIEYEAGNGARLGPLFQGGV